MINEGPAVVSLSSCLSGALRLDIWIGVGQKRTKLAAVVQCLRSGSMASG